MTTESAPSWRADGSQIITGGSSSLAAEPAGQQTGPVGSWLAQAEEIQSLRAQLAAATAQVEALTEECLALAHSRLEAVQGAEQAEKTAGEMRFAYDAMEAECEQAEAREAALREALSYIPESLRLAFIPDALRLQVTQSSQTLLHHPDDEGPTP